MEEQKMIAIEISRNVEYENWWSFIEQISVQSNEYSMFRGHSNFQPINSKEEFTPWEIKSSYNRYQNDYCHLNKMEEFASIRKYISYYKTESFNFDTKESSILEFLQFLQHYGIQTPLIDFTVDYLTALYFAASGIPSNAKQETEFENEYRYITIIELDYNLLQYVLDAKLLENELINAKLTDDQEKKLISD